MIFITTVPPVPVGPAVVVAKLEYTLASSTVNLRAESSYSWAIGALPANSRVLGTEYETDAAWDKGNNAYIRLGLYEGNTDANGAALINGGNLETGAGVYGALDSNNLGLPQENYQTRGAQDLDLMVFVSVNLASVGAGANVTVRVFYAVIA